MVGLISLRDFVHIPNQNTPTTANCSNPTAALVTHYWQTLHPQKLKQPSTHLQGIKPMDLTKLKQNTYTWCATPLKIHSTQLLNLIVCEYVPESLKHGNIIPITKPTDKVHRPGITLQEFQTARKDHSHQILQCYDITATICPLQGGFHPGHSFLHTAFTFNVQQYYIYLLWCSQVMVRLKTKRLLTPCDMLVSLPAMELPGKY